MDEANAALPELEVLLRRGREVLDELREAQTQLQDMKVAWGDSIRSPACPEHGRYRSYVEQALALKAQLRVCVMAFEEFGVVLKDLDRGLVDFHAMRGNELVFLCWLAGEHKVSHWHTLEGGFTTRQPVPDIRITP